MALDMKKMRAAHQQNQRGGDLWKPPAGKTKVYIHPPCRGDADTYEPTAGTNLISLAVRYDVGPKKAMAVCMDPERNPILTHPFVQKFLKEKGIKIGKGDPIDRAIAAGDIDPEDAAKMRLNTRFIFGLTPIMSKASKSAEEWTKLAPKPSIALIGQTIYDGIMDELLGDNGDITDPDAAIFLVIGREGEGKLQTKYEVKADPDTVRKPKALPPAFQALLNKAMQPGGDCDLFKFVANMCKTQEEITALLGGATVRTGRGISKSTDDDDDDDSSMLEDEDDETPPPKAKAKAKPVVEEEEEEEELLDEDEEETPPPKKKSVAPAAKKVVEEEIDEEDLFDEEDEDEPAPPKKAVAKPAIAKKAKAEPVEDDEDLLDEDEPVAPKKKAKPVPVEEESVEDELDALEAELEEIQAPKKRGRPPGSKNKS